MPNNNTEQWDDSEFFGAGSTEPAKAKSDGWEDDDFFQDKPAIAEVADGGIAIPEIDPVLKRDGSSITSISNVVRGAGERVTDLAGNLAGFAATTGDNLESNNGIGGLVWEGGSVLPTYKDAEEYKAWQENNDQETSNVLRVAQNYLENVKLGYTPRNTWEGVKESSGAWDLAKNVAGFAYEQGLVSIPDMVAMVANMPAYLSSRTEEIAQERAANSGRDAPSSEDVAIGGTAALIVTALDRFGLDTMLAPFKGAAGSAAKKIGIATGTEAVTEGIQEGIEYTAERAGTNKPFDIDEMLDRAAAGAVAGGPFGGAMAGTGVVTNAVLGRNKEKEDAEEGADTAPLDADAEVFGTDNNEAVDLTQTDTSEPLGLPAPVVQVDSEGVAGTQAQREQAAAAEQERMDSLGIGEGDKKAIQRMADWDAQSPAAARRTMAKRLPENFTDPRLGRDDFRNALEGMIERDFIEGGGITLIPDVNAVRGESDVGNAPLKRTPSLNPDWAQAILEENQISVKDVKKAVESALAGKKLGVRQANVVTGLLDQHSGERTKPEYLEFKNQARKEARDLRRIGRGEIAPLDEYAQYLDESAGEQYEENAYAMEWTGEARSLYEIINEASDVNTDMAEQLLERMAIQGASNAEIASALYSQIINRGQDNAQTERGSLVRPEEIAGGQEAGLQAQAAPIAGAGLTGGQRPVLGRIDRPAEPIQQAATAAPVAQAAPATIPAPTEAEAVAEAVAAVNQIEPEVTQHEPDGRREQDMPVTRDKRKSDRRKNQKAREHYESMSHEELVSQLLKHELTGIKGRRAFVIEQQEADHFVSVDADSLKWVNDNMSPDNGDALLQAVADALVEEFGYDNVYHISGDEFYVLGFESNDAPAIKQGMERVESRLKGASIESEKPDGTQIALNGLAATAGYGQSKQEADNDLKREKQSREARGERAGRGEAPTSATIRTPEGKQDKQGDVAADGRGASEKQTAKAEEKPKLKHPGKKADKAPSKEGVPVSEEQETDALTPEESEATRAKRKAEKETQDDFDYIQKDIYNWMTPKEIGSLNKQAPNHYDDIKAAVDWWSEKLVSAQKRGWPKGKEPVDKHPGKKQPVNKQPVEKDDLFADDIDAAAHEAATSPKNDLPAPTEAQKEAGNYKKGHLSLHGLDISIENPKGSKRRPEWPALKHHYGYIKKTESADGDHIDVFLGPDAENADLPVFVVDQIAPTTGAFDEHKILIGFKNIGDAQKGYLGNYAKGWKGLGKLNQMTMDEFKAWLEGDTSKPVSYKEKAHPGKKKAVPVEAFYDDVIKRVYDGKATLEEYKSAFESLLANKDDIIESLSSKTKAELLNARGSMFEYRNKNDRKSDVIDSYYRDLISDFVLGQSFQFGMGKNAYEKGVSAVVEKQTDETLKEFAESIKKQRDERKQEMEKRIAGVKDPKTLDDFMDYIRVNAKDDMTYQDIRMTLTPEQRTTFDILAGEKTRDARQARADQQKTEVKVAGQTTGAQIVEGVHSKYGHPIWSVQLEDRVDGDSYKTLLSTAKRMGGNYVNTMLARRWKTVWGFQFKDMASAEAFMKLAAGDTEAAQEVVQAKRDAYKDDKSQSAVERLSEMADKLEERADDSLSQDRKENTARRAGFAASARAKAEAGKAMAETMRKIAAGIESGKARFLDRVRTKAQIEMLESAINTAKYDQHIQKYKTYSEQENHKYDPPDNETADFAKWPTYSAYRSDWAKLGRQLSEIEGTKKLGQKILKVADDVTDAYIKFAKENLIDVSKNFIKQSGDIAAFKTKRDAELAITRSGIGGVAIVLPVKRNENLIILSPSEAQKRGIWNGDADKRITLSADVVDSLIGKARYNNKVDVPWQLESASDKRKRLASMGIETPAEYRAALREFIDLRQAPKAPDKIKEMERAMIGRRKDGLDFFPTPATIADEMVEVAAIEEGMTVLEPSAGMGHIADRIRESGVEPDVVEMSGDRRELLEAKGYNLVGHDFMDVTEKYDRIIMNPPFSDRRDAAHVQHAYDLLKPNGRLVAIVGEGVFFGSDKKAQAFRDWLESVGGTDEKLEEGTFNDPSLPVNTGVNARMVVIEKDAAAKFSRSKTDDSKFRKSTKAEPSGLSSDAVQETVDRIADIRATIDPLMASLDNAVPVEVVEDYSGLPDAVERKRAAEGVDIEAAAYRGKVYLVASQISSPERAKVVLMDHELRHIGLRKMFGRDLTNILRQAWLSKEGPKIRQFAAEIGIQTADKAGKLEAAEEYIVHLAETGQTNNLLEKVIAAIRAWLRDAGWNLEISDIDLRAIVAKAGTKDVLAGTPGASGILQRAFSRQGPTFYSQMQRVLVASKNAVVDGARTGTSEATAYSKSKQTDSDFVSEVLNELAEYDEFFRYPVSESQSIDGVMSEVFPGAEYLGEDTRMDEVAESGADVRHLFKSPQGKQFYVYTKGDDIWIDVSWLEEGERGSGIYAAVANYAYNTGKTFIGDPHGLSEAAVIRRTSNMLSSALRFGTTEHLGASQEQIKGDSDKGIEPLKWSGTDMDKLKALVHTFTTTLFNQFPKLDGYRYDFTNSRFVDRNGREVSQGRFGEAGSNNDARKGRAGEATLRRGIFIKSLMESEGGKRPGILEQVFTRGNSLVNNGGLNAMFSRRNDENEVQRSQQQFNNDLNAGQPIDKVFRAAFQTLKIDKLTKAVYDRGVKYLTEAKFPTSKDDGVMSWMNGFIETARAGLIDRYGLPESYVQRDFQREADKRKIELKAVDFLKSISERGVTNPREASVLQAVLTGEQIPEGDWQSLAAPIREAIDQLGQEALELGLITRESYDRNKGTYLHRVYRGHETSQTSLGKWVSKMNSSRRKRIRGDELKGRGMTVKATMDKLLAVTPRDWWGRKEQIGRADRGLKNAEFHVFDRLSHTGEGTENLPGMEQKQQGKLKDRVYWPADIPVPAKYQAWENRGKWKVRDVQGDKVVLWRDFTKGERTNMGEILDARYTITKTFMLMAHDLATGRFLKDIATNETWAKKERPAVGDAFIEDNPRRRFSTFSDVEWVKVPEDSVGGTQVKKWGALSGMYVRAEIWRDLNELDRMQMPGFWQTILTQWKLNKALALDTPIPTPDGWTTMGKIKVGDRVFDEKGQVCTVLEVKDIQHSRPCYEVEFSDGCKIVADEDHWWFTKMRGRDGVRTTKEILDTLKEPTRGDNNHSVPVSGPIVTDKANLPISAYAFGVWLGDGDSYCPRISSGKDDVDELVNHLISSGVRCGDLSKDKRNNVVYFTIKRASDRCPRNHDISEMREDGKGCKACAKEARWKNRERTPVTNARFGERLRDMDAYNNKHIPSIYLRSSIDQRRELLMGLMDSDGCVTKNGDCIFTTSIPRLRDDMTELLRSLGYKPTARMAESKLNGETKKPSWRIYFRAYSNTPVFKLQRKLDRLKAEPKNNQRSRSRMIVSIKPVESVPVRCISVSSESHLYLAGEGMIPTHNTARNPVVHLNNVMSNLIFMDMADIRWRDLKRALYAYRHKTQEYRDAMEHGAFGASYIEHEIRRDILDPILEEMMSQDKALKTGAVQSFMENREWLAKMAVMGKMADVVVKQGIKVDRKFQDWYQFEDEIFRMATYMRRLGMGDDTQTAARMARDQFLNYDIRAPWVNAARRSFLPFISYTYRAVPVIAKSIAERPWKIAKYATIAYMMNMLGYMLAPGDDDEDKERRSMREQEQGLTWLGTPRMIRMPMLDDYGNPIFLDIRRWIPAGDVFDTNQSQGAVPLPAWLQFGGPLMIAAELALNKQAFTGQEIINRKTDEWDDIIAKDAMYLWRSWMPSAPWIPGGWYWDKIKRSASGGRDVLGRDYSVPMAVSSSFGIKLQAHDVDLGFAYRSREYDAIQRELGWQLRQLEQDKQRQLIDEDQYQKERANLMRKMKNLAADAKETFGQ